MKLETKLELTYSEETTVRRYKVLNNNEFDSVSLVFKEGVFHKAIFYYGLGMVKDPLELDRSKLQIIEKTLLQLCEIELGEKDE